MKKQQQRKYAKLILEVGVHLVKGQKLIVSAEAYHIDFLTILTEEAYKMGAAYVLIDSDHPQIFKARIDHADTESLESLPHWLETKYACMIDEEWARVRIFGPTDPEMLGKLDSKKLSIAQKAASVMAKPISEACGSGKISWCAVALPTPQWAAMVYGDIASPELENKLWLEIVKILSLDADNPSEVWRKKANIIHKRCETLMKLSIDRLHFHGNGTDLSVYCLANAQWIGGSIENTQGRSFIPNLPTEECFTTPHASKTTGKAQIVRPVTVLGKQVVNAWFKFSEGKVVDYGAEKNKEALDAYFKMCPRASYLGEVALVDSNSPIFQSGEIFHCILFDENASCHVALGNGYPMAVPNGLEMTKEERDEIGVNASLLHTDFMIGGPEVEVTAYDIEGNATPLIKNGVFVI